jgi:carbon storage regulator CsrA
MLVLSRRQGQRILFPNLDISVQILSSKGSTVRLGIDAPSHVNVLREEVEVFDPAQPLPSNPEDRARHDLRGRLNTLTMALHVVEKQLSAGLTAEAEQTLREAQRLLEQVPSMTGSPTSPEQSRKPIQALLVEDNPNEEALLSSYLRLSGFGVETVRDGYEVLEFLAGHQRPDFLLLDMRLPRFDGPATISAIRQNPSLCGLRIFAVTGSAPAEFDLPAGGSGVDAWFQKPLNPRRIVEAMSATALRN